MHIKHSKYKNTGLIFELLVKQVTADILNQKSSPAVSIIRNFFTKNTSLTKEFKLYEYVSRNSNLSQNKAESIVSTITEIARSLNVVSLKSQKYNLIKEVKQHYDLDEFFSIKIDNYKPLAALYCLLEAYKQQDVGVVDPQFLINNKTTLLEHFTQDKQNKNQVKDSLIQEYSKYNKDLKLLTFKILLEKFNTKYAELLPEQKRILREFINSVNSSNRLRTLVNSEFSNIKSKLQESIKQTPDEVTKIKLKETVKGINHVPKSATIKDQHLVNLLQYYQLVAELKNL
jgi:hypothetical protein